MLFIDAHNAASGRISRTQIEFSDDDLHKIAQLYHRWRGTDFSDGEAYADEKGLCFSASLADIEKHDFVLMSAHHSRLWNINVLDRAPIWQKDEQWAQQNNARVFLLFVHHAINATHH